MALLGNLTMDKQFLANALEAALVADDPVAAFHKAVADYPYWSVGWCSAHGHWRHQEGHGSCPTCHAEPQTEERK